MTQTYISPNHREVTYAKGPLGAAPLQLDSGGNLKTVGSSGGGLVTSSYDYIAYTNTNSTTDTYVYKSGGSGGTTVATVTIVFTDTSKQQMSTVTRT